MRDTIYSGVVWSPSRGCSCGTFYQPSYVLPCRAASGSYGASGYLVYRVLSDDSSSSEDSYRVARLIVSSASIPSAKLLTDNKTVQIISHRAGLW